MGWWKYEDRTCEEPLPKEMATWHWGAFAVPLLWEVDAGATNSVSISSTLHLKTGFQVGTGGTNSLVPSAF